MSEDAAVQEWLTLLEVSSRYMFAAEAMIDALQGRLGDGPLTREQAAHLIKGRTTDYIAARRNFIEYARTRERMLTCPGG